jgi:hypothetical protein
MNPEIAELRAALKNVVELCEGGRQSVNDVCTAIRQVDQDAAAAICRGHFLTISQYAEAIHNRTSAYGDDSAAQKACAEMRDKIDTAFAAAWTNGDVEDGVYMVPASVMLDLKQCTTPCPSTPAK